MTTVIRHTDIVNASDPDALLPSGTAAIVCNKGQDYGLQVIKRTFTDAEIGDDAGQTQDAQTPTTGFLFAQFQGCNIENVVSVFLVKDITGEDDTTVFQNFAWAQPDDTAGGFITSLNFRIVNPLDDPTTVGFQTDFASLYLLDLGTDESTQIEAGDRVIALVELGQIG